MTIFQRELITRFMNIISDNFHAYRSCWNITNTTLKFMVSAVGEERNSNPNVGDKIKKKTLLRMKIKKRDLTREDLMFRSQKT